MSVMMKGKHLTSILDLTNEEIHQIFQVAERLKLERMQGITHHILPGRTLGMIFEKPSTRTRVSFEVGINQLGGMGLYLSSKDLQLGRGETIADTARVMSRYVDGIMARVFSHNTITELAKHATIPIINGLSDFEHPCQALADLFTAKEKFGSFRNLKMAYIGDGNNVCNSLMFLCAKLGVDFASASPGGYLPNREIVEKATEIAKLNACGVATGTDPFEAVMRAQIIYTDVWVSMGDEAQKAERLKQFEKYRVNKDLLELADRDAIVMHCLPAHRGEEITDEVLDGPKSVVWDEAENRMHVQKAVMALLMR